MSHRLGTAVTWSKASTVDGHAVLVLDRTPIRLAGPLAHLLAELVEQPAPSGWAANSPRRWLFPGNRPGQHLSGLFSPGA